MLRGLLNTVLFGNFFIAWCAGALSAATGVLLGRPPEWRVPAFAFAATLAVYSLHALYMHRNTLTQPDSERQLWLLQHRRLLAVSSALALLAALILLATVKGGLLLWLAHLAVIALAYTVPLVPCKGRWLPLRAVPLLKVLLIAYAWAAVTVLLPAAQYGAGWLDQQVRQVFAERFLFILALALLFDIRDMATDRQARVLTLPVLAGPTATQLLSVVLLLVFGGLAAQHHPWWLAWPLLVSALAAIWVVLLTRQKRSEWFFSGWADGIMLLQAVLVLAAGAVW